jgi:hypothetical protein
LSVRPSLLAAPFLLVHLFICSTTSGQDITTLLDPEPIDWSVWETAPQETKRALLERLNICVDQPDMLGSHHLVDFSGDGVLDLIYSGDDVACDYPSTGSKRTAFFLAELGHFSEIFIHNGELEGMWRGGPWQPVSFLVRGEECCGSVYVHYNYFYPVERGGSLKFESYHQIVAVVDMPTPDAPFEAPRPFIVPLGPYSLRVTHGVDGTFVWPYSRPHDPTGNLLATYRTDAKGIALGEATAADGSVWWFVLMDGSSRPYGFRGFQGEWERSPVGRSYLGWMLANGLREVDWLPRSIDSDRYWRRQ